MTTTSNVLVVTTSADHFLGDPDHKTGVWLEEFAVPYLELRKLGAVLTVVSPKGGPMPIDPRSDATAQQEVEWQEPIAVSRQTVPLSSVLADAFTAVFLPGGHGPMFDLPDDAELKALLHAFDVQGKVISAMCHGPAGLLGATAADGRPLVAGKRLTSYTWREEKVSGLYTDVPFNLQQRLAEEGALFDEAAPRADHAVRDGRLVTGQNPWSSASTARLIVEALNEAS